MLFNPAAPGTSAGRSKSGTGLSIITEGTRLGSRSGARPRQNQAAMPAKTKAGTRKARRRVIPPPLPGYEPAGVLPRDIAGR